MADTMDENANMARAREKCDGYAAKFAAPLMTGQQILAKQQQLGEGIVLVDVRSAEEIAVSSVQGSITQRDFEALEGTLDKGATVVVSGVLALLLFLPRSSP